MFGTSGVRGTVGEDITAATGLAVGRALAAGDARTAVVGRDVRPSGRVLADATSAGLREGGCDVIRLGVAATPTVARSVAWRDADVGVAVTASHNPATDNGLKLWTPSGRAFDDAERRAVARRIEDGAFAHAAWDGHGTERRWDGASDRHRERLVGGHDALDDLSVVVDVGNGTGRVTADALSALGATVRTLDGQRDGSFPARHSEPTAETCEALCRVVAAMDADLGVAHDGDADRMLAATGAGEFVGGDRLLALFASRAVSSGEAVAVPVNASLLVEDAVAAAGGTVRHTRVGDVFVAEAATDDRVVFGGEPSGSWIWPDETCCPDGPLAACKLAALVDRAGDLTTLLEPVGGYHIRRETVETGRKEALMEALSDRVGDRIDPSRIDRRDGVRASFDDGWFLVRASGTEPLIRLTSEARSRERAADLLERATTLVRAAEERTA